MEEENIQSKIRELEKINESNFEEDLFERKLYEVSFETNKISDFIYLANMARWAEFNDESRAIEIAGNLMDKAIDTAVKEKRLEELEEIHFELEAGLEMEDRAQEVKEIIKQHKQ